ncbi:MAG: hypothetical protein KDB88_04295 [Flavobacteriales bacterium]|nr:hypothetical protein [Flavobacteriales bacterium]
MNKWILAFTVVVLTSCKKDEVLPSVPEIELISVSPTVVQSFGEPVILRFKYQDGDGDLGEPDPDSYSLEVKDSRLNAADGYHVPPLAPLDSEVAIEGELEVELTPLFLLGNGAQETVTYSIRLRDRAGNWSNTLVSPAVMVVDSL